MPIFRASLKLISSTTMFLILFLVCPVWALSPLIQYNDLVAGEGERGFEDGAFYSALFNEPYGLALSADGSQLWVADMGNNRIRLIDLNHGNKVSTLAGDEKAGRQDGPLANASFNQPLGILCLPDGRLVVNDNGNSLIRLIDLNQKAVTTLAGDGFPGFEDGPPGKSKTGFIWSMAFIPGENAVYFTQPDNGALRKLDLQTNTVSTLFQKKPRLPNPGALCVFNGKIYIADRKKSQVYEFSKALPDAKNPYNLVPVGTGQNILSLAGSGDTLYAYQAVPQNPIQRLFPKPGSYHFISVWGTMVENPGPTLIEFEPMNDLPPGFIADPLSGGRFYVSNAANNLVGSLRDLQQDFYNDGNSNDNPDGFKDFIYPKTKPPRTYRILLVGRSSVATDANPVNGPNPPKKMNYMAKKLELNLNTLAALDDAPLRYEVFGQGLIQKHSLFLWPYYEAPPVVEKYDIDLVIVMMDPGTYLSNYFTTPFTKEGIPSLDGDGEYLLKPYLEKIPEGDQRRFFDICRTHQLVSISGSNQINFHGFSELLAQSDVRESLLGIVGKPLWMLNHKLAGMKNSSGKPVKLEICFFSSGRVDFSVKIQKSFWKELAERDHIPFLDITDDLTALRLTYSPFTELNGMDHLTANGNYLFGYILGHELIKQKMIPFLDTDSKNPGQ